MSFSYKPLCKLLIDKKLTNEQFMAATGISKLMTGKLRRGEQGSVNITDRICPFFECNGERMPEHIREASI